MKQQVIVYKQTNRYAGWPANVGLWQWGNEIVVGFGLGYCKDNGPGRHPVDHDRKGYCALSRSYDGGSSWQTEIPADLNPDKPRYPQPCPGGIDFQSPDFAMLFTGAPKDAQATASWFYSLDRCKTWQGPFTVPQFSEVMVIAARTDYIVTHHDEAIVCLTADKSNQKEGRSFCCKIEKGGASFRFLGFIGDEPKGETEYAIMPSTVRLGEQKLLTVLRCCDDEEDIPGKTGYRLHQYSSPDMGRDWHFDGVIADDFGGNPAALIKLQDGRLCVVYGRRIKPYGILCRYSPDEGKTWSEADILRDDGDNWDLGYPRACQLPDGSLLAVYYFNQPNHIERFIAATKWDQID
jgi:hypothetical protein